jgi:hypothetical protein
MEDCLLDWWVFVCSVLLCRLHLSLSLFCFKFINFLVLFCVWQ